MAGLELGGSQYREHGQCPYGQRLDRRHPGRLVGSIYVRRDPVHTHGYLNFTFWVHGGATGGQTIQVVAVVNDVAQPGVRVASPAAGTWQKITVPLFALGADDRSDVNGFWVQQGSGVDEPTPSTSRHCAGVRRSTHSTAASRTA